MELERNFMKFFAEFQKEIAKLQANLNYLNDLVSILEFFNGQYNNNNKKKQFHVVRNFPILSENPLMKQSIG